PARVESRPQHQQQTLGLCPIADNPRVGPTVVWSHLKKAVVGTSEDGIDRSSRPLAKVIVTGMRCKKTFCFPTAVLTHLFSRTNAPV
ncbi:MAG: hypothetical protein ACK4VM_16125, partial [Bosea sp. (in: a-proteobacteria)]